MINTKHVINRLMTRLQRSVNHLTDSLIGNTILFLRG